MDLYCSFEKDFIFSRASIHWGVKLSRRKLMRDADYARLAVVSNLEINAVF